MFIGLALVEQNGDKFILETPAFCGIEEGDTIVDENNKTGKVIDTMNCVSTSDKSYRFLQNFYGKFRRVKGRLDFIECVYKEEEE